MPRITLIFACLALLVLAACGEAPTTSNTPANTPAAVTATPALPPTPASFGVGQPVHVGNWIVTLNKVSESAGDQFDTPKGIYLILDASFQNTAAAGHSVNSFIQFNLVDSTGQVYTPTITSLANVTAPDTENVLPGKTVRGETVYDVPTSVKSFEWTFTDVAGDGASAVWDFTVS